MDPRLKQLITPTIDILLAPIVLMVAPITKHIARWGSNYPISRSILDHAEVAFVLHHYYEPIVFPSDIRLPLNRPRNIVGLNLNEDRQLEVLRTFDYRDELLDIPFESTGAREYYYNNRYFEVGDGEYLYNMIRHFKPRRIVEIGAGFSTLMARRAILRNQAQDAGYSCTHVCIEPFEQPWLEDLGIQVLRNKVEDCPASVFEPLTTNDILFIDSSHVIRPQGDVLYEYLQLLGSLTPGVIVHVHDIFTPRDYPETWVLRNRHMWDEQYLLEAFLCFNRAFEVIGAVNWLSHEHRDKLEKACPQLLRNPNAEPGSFWFRRVS